MRILRGAALLLATLVVTEATANSQDDGDKRLSGMSIIGNDEAPKSLVIVPWKASETWGRRAH